MARSDPIPAYVLAGGFSRRFGENKALFPYRGQPLIQYPLDILRGLCRPVKIVAKDTAPYAEFGVPVLADALDQQSPLVGIWSGLDDSPTK